MSAYEWGPALSAHPEFPMELVSGVFRDGNGTEIEIRGGKPINTGWGEASGFAATGPDKKPAPTKLALVYFSYVEDRFYKGVLDLPAEMMRSRLADGFENQREGRTGAYDLVLVGMGAGGHVSVWLGGEGHVHEIAAAVVPETDLSWSDFRPETRYDRKTYVDLVLSEMGVTAREELNGPERFAEFQKTFPWSLSVQSDGPPGDIRLSYFNGERDFFNLMRPFTQRAKLAVPKDVRLTWTGVDGQNYVANLEFNEDETIKAFEQLGSAGQAKLSLELRIADTNRNVMVFLRNDDQFYAFEEASIKVFRRQN